MAGGRIVVFCCLLGATCGCGRFGFRSSSSGSPCASLAAEQPAMASGIYLVSHVGADVEVECDMEHLGGGWTVMARLEPGDACPSGWSRVQRGGVTFCAGAPFPCHGGQRSAFFALTAGSFQEVAGVVAGYQYKSTDAFSRQPGGVELDHSDIDGSYVDGVSITTGTARRTHIWTYASGLNKDATSTSCPCSGGAEPPPFVEDHYFCDTGNEGPYEEQWYLDRPLWDDDATDASCASPGAAAWFYRSLTAPSRAPIEVRMMADQCDEDLGISGMRILVR